MNTKKVVVSVLVLALLVAGGIFYSHTPPPARANIKIGAILPLSGQYAFLGESERNSMTLAVEKANAEGAHIQMIFEDDKYDTKTGLSAYEKLKSIDNVDAVVAVSAPVLGALKPVVAEDHLLLFSLGESLFHENDTVFQLMPASDKVAPKLGEEAARRYKKIAVVYSNSGALWEQWRDNFSKGVAGDAEIQTFALPSGGDYRTEIQKILAFKPDAATVFLPLGDGVNYLKELQIYDPLHKISIICDGNLEFSIGEYTSKVGSDIFKDCISTTLPDTMTAEFVSAYKAKFNADPILTDDYAYDSISILADLAKHSKGEWIGILNDNYTSKGASGTIKFNNVGTRFPEVVVHQFKDGKFVPI